MTSELWEHQTGVELAYGGPTDEAFRVDNDAKAEWALRKLARFATASRQIRS